MNMVTSVAGDGFIAVSTTLGGLDFLLVFLVNRSPKMQQLHPFELGTWDRQIATLLS